MRHPERVVIAMSVAFVGMFLLLFAVLRAYRAQTRTTSCINNQRILAVGIDMYAQDHDGVYIQDTQTFSWSWKLAVYNLYESIDCPESAFPGVLRHPDYGFNAHLFGQHMSAVVNPKAVVMVADAPPNVLPANYAFTLADSDPPRDVLRQLSLRHARQKYVVVTFADAHVDLLDANLQPKTAGAPAVQFEVMPAAMLRKGAGTKPGGSIPGTGK
jgi:hypothetical protein